MGVQLLGKGLLGSCFPGKDVTTGTSVIPNSLIARNNKVRLIRQGKSFGCRKLWIGCRSEGVR
jgi:hypothetical protein